MRRLLHRLRRRWLTILGAWLLALGLGAAVWTNHTHARLMGDTTLGVAVLAPEKGSSAWREKERLRTQADFGFWLGIVLGTAGLVVQTVGTLLDR